MSKTRTRILAGLTGVTVAASLGLASPAEAVDRNGVCDAGEFCYYYNSNHTGSVSDFRSSVANYATAQPACYDFKGIGAGKGLCIKNNAASVWNRSASTVRVHFNSNYGGSAQSVAPGAKVNLNTTLRKQNASHLFVGSNNVSYRSGDDYPYKGQTGEDPWRFYKGQCTSFAAWALRSRVGVSDFTNYYKGPRWSHAMYWDNVARSVGIPVTGTPRAGAIAVRNSGTFGHVAFVTKVNANGTFEVDEYNYNGTSRYSHRTTSVGSGSAYFDAFIHFK
jgi:surface antigen